MPLVQIYIWLQTFELYAIMVGTKIKIGQASQWID